VSGISPPRIASSGKLSTRDESSRGEFFLCPVFDSLGFIRVKLPLLRAIRSPFNGSFNRAKTSFRVFIIASVGLKIY